MNLNVHSMLKETFVECYVPFLEAMKYTFGEVLFCHLLISKDPYGSIPMKH